VSTSLEEYYPLLWKNTAEEKLLKWQDLAKHWFVAQITLSTWEKKFVFCQLQRSTYDLLLFSCECNAWKLLLYICKGDSTFVKLMNRN